MNAYSSLPQGPVLVKSESKTFVAREEASPSVSFLFKHNQQHLEYRGFENIISKFIYVLYIHIYIHVHIYICVYIYKDVYAQNIFLIGYLQRKLES